MEAGFGSIARALALAGASLALGACVALPPQPLSDQPMTARPQPLQTMAGTPGSLYREGGFRPLFEDPRARNVGDTIIIAINEKASATSQANTSLSRAGKSSLSVPNISKLPLRGLQGMGIDGSGSTSSDGKGTSAINNAFTGTIAATVIEVLPNGNMVISGEKQVAINQGHEYIRVTGVANPSMVVGNTISSLQLADAKVQYKQSGTMEEVQGMGWAQRFFNFVSPF